MGSQDNRQTGSLQTIEARRGKAARMKEGRKSDK